MSSKSEKEEVTLGLRFVNEKREDNEALALAAMQVKARELGVKGVAFALICKVSDNTYRPVFKLMGRMERDPDPSKNTPNTVDTGADYIAIAFSKIAEMFLTGKDSGMPSGRPFKRGELGVRGGKVIYDDLDFFYTSFSGGTEDQDVLIAEAGQKATLV